MNAFRELAGGLDSQGWQSKQHALWTPLQWRAFEAASDAERLDWFEWEIHEPLECEYDDETGELLTITSKEGAVLWRGEPFEPAP
jgi:hypothetical protein